MKRKKIKPFTKQELDAIKRNVKREKSRINFRCPLCGDSVTMFPGCKIKEIFCACGFPEHTKPVKMLRINGFFCKYRFDLDNKKCDYCGVCDTGTDADFDTYAVQVDQKTRTILIHFGSGSEFLYNIEEFRELLEAFSIR